MEELGYQPNVLASAMKGKYTFTIALLIPDIENPIYAQYYKHIEKRGQELGYSIVMASTERDPEKEAKHIQLLRQKRVDGFILASIFNNDQILNRLILDKVPLVLFAHERPGFSVNTVTVDDYIGGYHAAQHLISLGHRRIGVVGEETQSTVERIRGYKQALSENNIDFDENLIIKVDIPTIEGAEEKAHILFEQKERPTAVFGCNDIFAIGTMQAAKKGGLSCPTNFLSWGMMTHLCVKL